MDQSGAGGGCCIARYSGNTSNIDTIMQKYRPIAPKPTPNGPIINSCVTKKAGRRGRKRERSPAAARKKPAVTLPLLPEAPDLKPQVWTKVVVERVTGRRVEDDVLGGAETTDEEKARRLEEDTCPGFVTDGWNRVVWSNAAFKKTFGEVVVWVVMVETVRWWEEEEYTCRERVETGGGGEGSVPCDVWRMRSGGFAWRLDVGAALRLGR